MSATCLHSISGCFLVAKADDRGDAKLRPATLICRQRTPDRQALRRTIEEPKSKELAALPYCEAAPTRRTPPRRVLTQPRPGADVALTHWVANFLQPFWCQNLL
jgi:hypothetical protein